jgi:hypothetical protein
VENVGIDEQDLVWFTDLWMAGFLLLGVVGLFIWTHGWIATGRPMRPTPMAIKNRRAGRARRPIRARHSVAKMRLLVIARANAPVAVRSRRSARTPDRPIAA